MVELERQNKRINTRIYNKVYKNLRKVIENDVPINHVGSTAVPNMYGKNIIDVLVGVKDETELDDLTLKLKNLGYFPGRNSSGMVYRFFASTEEETKSGDIHIHLVIIDSDRYKDFLISKEYLLKNKSERDKYSNFKKSLIKNGYFVRDDYKSLKSEYVSALLERARKDINI